MLPNPLSHHAHHTLRPGTWLHVYCRLVQRWTCNQTKPPHYPSVKRTSAPCDNNNCLKEWHWWKRFASSIHMVNICMYVHVDIIVIKTGIILHNNKIQYVCTQFMNKCRYECVPNQLFTVFQPAQKLVRDWSFINSCLMNCDYWKNQQVQTGKTGRHAPCSVLPGSLAQIGMFLPLNDTKIAKETTCINLPCHLPPTAMPPREGGLFNC